MKGDRGEDSFKKILCFFSLFENYIVSNPGEILKEGDDSFFRDFGFDLRERERLGLLP